MGSNPAQVKKWVDLYNDLRKAFRFFVTQEGKGDVAEAQAALEKARTRWQEALNEISESIDSFEIGWYYAYRLAFEVVRGERHPRAEHATNSVWRSTVTRVRDYLATYFWGPLEGILRKLGVTEVLLLPAGVSTLLPLHAAAPNWLTVAYAPSLGVWQRSRSVGTRELNSMLLATPAAHVPLMDRGLPWTLSEAEWLIAHAEGLPITHLDTQGATVETVSDGMLDHSIAHFAGHAHHVWINPLASGLECHDDILRLEDMTMLNLKAVRLVTLSACSTGVSDILSGEEMVGLPGGLLAAGAPAVVASLWPVHDVSTAFLMDEFYSQWLHPQGEAVSIALALKRAAEWLQTATKATLLERLAARTTNERAKERVLDAYRAALGDAPNPQVDTDLVENIASVEDSEDWEDDKFVELLGATDRLAVSQTLEAAIYLRNRLVDPPFADAYYWAPFAAYGVVLDEDKE